LKIKRPLAARNGRAGGRVGSVLSKEFLDKMPRRD
jgi:hypothetical protein